MILRRAHGSVSGRCNLIFRPKLGQFSFWGTCVYVYHCALSSGDLAKQCKPHNRLISVVNVCLLSSPTLQGERHLLVYTLT